jgi:hypothetical protein
MEGSLADKSDQLILQALHRAVGEDHGVPLFAGRSSTGLFSASSSGKKAAQLCKDQGFVRTLRTERKGRTSREICAITDKGLAFLLVKVSPQEVVESLLQSLRKHLESWQAAESLEDCPLPELYHSARRACATLTIGLFHDGIRTLHERKQIYLHPWTGPLYEIPEPALALLVGHEIAYYASMRR